jgi:hypothetical protein
MPRSARFLTLLGSAAALIGLLAVASAQATHPRPKSASPIRLTLVPGYSQCTASSRTHGPPLAFPSCNPPAQISGQATVGTPDAFGGPANASSFIRFRASVGVPGPPDEGDILIDAEINDVRCAPTGSRCGTANASGPADYSGEIRYKMTFRLTDHRNAVNPGGGTDPATVQDLSIEASAVCAQTASTSTGSICDINTTMRLIFPGAPGPDGQRVIWEFNDVTVYDGGPDGDGDTTGDNTVFLRPGIFIP